MFFPLSNATSILTTNFPSCESGDANLELDFGVSIRSSIRPFFIISRIILWLVTFSHLVKWFLRFPSLKFWISLFGTGIISCWNFKIVVVPTLMQLSFSRGIVIVDTPAVVFGGCCNLWFGCCCCCTPCYDFQVFWEIFGQTFNTILMTLDNWTLSSLPEMSVLFLRIIRVFVTSLMAMLLWELAPGIFALSGLYYDPEHSFVLAKSLYWIFSRINQNSSLVFICFHFCFEFFKGFRVLLNFICNICKIFIDFFPYSFIFVKFLY